MLSSRRLTLGLLLLSLSASCQQGYLNRKGTFTCSCSSTGCTCKHCTGESTTCNCRATDAYPNNTIGDGD
jgi:hypothetical protein